MFAGLDEIDWSSLEHAYGSAEDVPEWIRGLLHLDPEVREESLDALYGAVHHQGDVYDSTVAAVPFLIEVLVTPDVPDRPRVAELLASIADISEMTDTELSDPGQRDFLGLLGRARQLIVDAGPALLTLAGHPDAALRAALPPLLATIAAELPGVTALLIERLAAESEPEVRRMVLDALGTAGIATGESELAGHLLETAASAPASTAVAALVAAVRINPRGTPVDGAAELLERAYAEDGTAVEPAGYETNTLVGSLRVLHEKQSAGRRAPHNDRIVEDLTDVLGPRVDERIDILLPLLASPHADLAGDALWATNKLIDGWRGDYLEIIERTAGMAARGGTGVVDWSDGFGISWPAIAERAEGFLRDWTPISAPAVEVVAGRLAALDALPHRHGLPAWAITFKSGPPALRPCLEMLAGHGDERAFPMLMAALNWERPPRNIANLLSRYPQHAGRIVAAISDPGDHGVVLRAFGPAAAPLVPLLLAAPLSSWTAESIGHVGPAAAEAVPLLEQATTSDDPHLAVAAAGALWRIGRWPDVLPTLTARLDGNAGAAALAVLADLGSEASAAAPYVATFLDTPDKYWWKPVGAALALWSITGEQERTVPVLTAAWQANPHLRLPIAETGMPSLAPLFEAELAAKHRHYAARAGSGSGSGQIEDDEALLRACRTALHGQG